ncbi:MAG: hypothetical protein II026_09860, partial [Bacteroidales bacterium]|nr:hypothetical protein [Bacteroidales bacterium]
MKPTFRSLLSPAALLPALLLSFLLSCCAPRVEDPTGSSVPDLGWLFTGKGPYTLQTKVDAAPGPATLSLVTDLSLMADTPDVVLTKDVTIAADSTLEVKLGKLAPGFYEVRLRDSIRWNIGVRPDAVVSAPDAQPDFDAFWEQTLAALDAIPLTVEWTEIPLYSNEKRTCFEVRYPSFDGGVSGG